MKHLNSGQLLVCILLLFVMASRAQVAISNDGLPPHPSAQLEVKSINKGLLLPRVPNPSQTVSNPAAGLILYNNSTQQPNFFNGSGWQALGGELVARFPKAIGFQGVINVTDAQTIYNWVVPSGISEIWVEMWAGGSAGSDFNPENNASDLTSISGGNAGDYASLFVTVTPAQSLTIRVGRGGGGSSNASGGNSNILVGTTTYEVRIFQRGLYLNSSLTNPIPGLLQFVSGGSGAKSEYSFQQSSATTFRRIIKCGKGGDAFPGQKGGTGPVVSFNATTGELIPSSLISLTTGSGATPGAGGSGGLGNSGSGGAGLIIVHY